MGMKLVDLFPAFTARHSFGLMDDFLSYTDTQLFTKLASDGGSSVAITAGAGGLLALTTGGTDNNEAMVATTNAVYSMADGKGLIFECRAQYAEANTSAANVAFGVSSAAAADLLVDNGAGPATSMSGALIFKVDGGTAFKCVSSKSTTQTISTSTLTAGSASYQVFRVEIRQVGDTAQDVAEATFWVDQGNGLLQLIDSTTARPIKHTVTYTSAAAMKACAYVKAGSASSEVLTVDYVAAMQIR